jgi:excinuclease UvrABC helicase subunit UvrB
VIFIAFPLSMTRITHHLKLLVIAVVLSLSSIYIIKHPDLFVSSVLNLQEIQEVETKQWDIAYKTDNQTLDIFMPLSGAKL